MCNLIFIESLFIIAINWKQPRCLSVGEWKKNLWYIHSTILFTLNNRKSHLGTWVSMNLQFSRSVVSDSLWPHGLQHTRLPCPSPNPRVLSRWCHPTISSSVFPFSSHLQSFPASGSFQMGQLLASGGQSIGVSASASVLPMNALSNES